MTPMKLMRLSVPPRQIQRQHHADQRQRQRQHDGDRRGERAELHHQHQVHHADAHDQRDAHLGEQFLLVARRAAEPEAEARREVHGVGDLHRLGRDLAGVHALHVGGHRDRALAVQVLDARRALVHRDGRDLLQRHHHVGAGHRDRQVLDVRGVDAVFGCSRTATSRDSPVGIDPVADFDAGERHAQRLRGVVHRDAELVGEAAVELDPQLVLRILLRQAHVHRARESAAACP